MPELDVIAKAIAALETSVASIIGCDENDATKREALVETFAQFQTYMDREGNGGKPLGKGRLEREQRSYRQTFEKIFTGKAGGDGIDRDDDGGDGDASDHHASKVADLLVEAGSHPNRASALSHLLHSPQGQALLARMHKKDDQTAKESNMDKIETVRDVVKRHGIIAVAKSIIDENRSYGITEHEFVALAAEHAKAAHPELTEAAAFAKIYQIPEVWRACNVLKAMPFVADVTPVMVGGEDTRDLSDTSKAIEQLKELGARRWPTASAADQFERALTDPANHTLARRAVPIPQPTTSYPFPR